MSSNNAPFCISEAKKEKGLFCCAYGCTNKANDHKGGLCHKHYARKLKAVDPVAARYNQFKSNSKRRGKINTITLEQFREFCQKTGYIIEKGKRGKNTTIDRINNRRGYHIDNIQLLTLSQNCRKGCNDFSDVPF